MKPWTLGTTFLLVVALGAGCGATSGARPSEGPVGPSVAGADSDEDSRSERAWSQTGLASYYDSALQGGSTANGLRYDEHGLTAAHRSLPFGTRVRVTNLASGKSVVVTITDRGPFVRGRIIDVSRKAAGKLGFIRTGIARVRVEMI